MSVRKWLTIGWAEWDESKEAVRHWLEEWGEIKETVPHWLDQVG